MSYATIDDLRSQLGGPTGLSQSPAYIAKMLHPLPDAKTIDREAFIVERAAGRVVIDFGASGPLHERIKKVAAAYLGVDRAEGDRVIAWDLDDINYAVVCPGVTSPPDLLVCGEVLEHLGNPQWFLTRLRREFPGVPVLLTTPNAFTAVGRGHLANGLENVNRDHVSWYSPRTLRTLLERVGYEIREFYWYGGGKSYRAEGMIVVAE